MKQPLLTDKKTLIDRIDAILPQTQCQQCGFAGCKPYATAIAEGRADINQCPPGNDVGIKKLAALLDVKPKPLDTTFGVHKPKAIALIDEKDCIGCTFCIRACPVDAIIGAAKQMHTIIITECTGCELCIEPCPMDCIKMVPTQQPDQKTQQKSADNARARYQFRLQRLSREKQEQTNKFTQKALKKEQSNTVINNDDIRKKTIIQAALKRAAVIQAKISTK